MKHIDTTKEQGPPKVAETNGKLRLLGREWHKARFLRLSGNKKTILALGEDLPALTGHSVTHATYGKVMVLLKQEARHIYRDAVSCVYYELLMDRLPPNALNWKNEL